MEVLHYLNGKTHATHNYKKEEQPCLVTGSCVFSTDSFHAWPGQPLNEECGHLTLTFARILVARAGSTEFCGQTLTFTYSDGLN